ncbi:MAG: hypothetical protein HY764_03725 [Candidatus Portnoybacteria bacterium]|nr:hypothetical protein [Candidatus Portnoybacteria bacterium]
MKISVGFDERRALEVFEILEKGWKEKSGIFEGIILPQDRGPLPENPLDLSLFLFYAAMFMRGGVISEDPFKWLHSLRREIPEIFNPGIVVNNFSSDNIENIFKGVTERNSDGENKTRGLESFLYKMKEHSSAWIRNSRALLFLADGNPLKLFEGAEDFEEVFAKIDKKKNGNGFSGMRRKIFSLFVIWLQEKNLIKNMPCPLPIDFHALRVLWSTGIIDFNGLAPFETRNRHPEVLKGKTAVSIRERLINEIAIWSQRFLAKNRMSHLAINPALWILSRNLCSRNFQNSSSQNGAILIEPEDLIRDLRNWPARYKNPCAVCPIEGECAAVVPAAPYYRWGILLKMKRVAYPEPQMLLPGIRPEAFFPLSRRSRNKEKK